MLITEIILFGVALSILLFGAVCGIKLRQRNLKIKQSYVKSEGTFVEFRKIGTTPRTYKGTIEYRTPDGGTHRFENMWAYYNKSLFMSHGMPPLGSKVEILYDSNNPTRAVVNDPAELNKYPALLVFICSLFFIFLFIIFIGRIWFAYQFGL